MSQPPAGGYPPPDPSQPGGYPPPAGNYPPPADPAGYQPPPAGYQPPPGYAAPPPGYSPPPPGYQQPAAGGYPPPAGSYPPPAGGYPPAPGYQGGAPAFPPAGGSGTPSFDVSKVGRSDWIVIGAGLVLLIFSFFGWLSASYDFGGGFSDSSSAGAWHEYWWLATVLGVAVAVVVALRSAMGQPLPQVKPQFLMFAAAAGFVITLIALIEIFAKTGDDGGGFSYGPGFGIWVCLVVSAAQTYFVWLWAQNQPGWSLPKLPGPALK